MRGDQISWLRQPQTIAKETASAIGSYVTRHLHLVAKDKKGPLLPNRLFLE